MKHARFALLFLVVTLSSSPAYETTELKPHTLEAFLRYARLTEAEILQEVRSERFLRIDNPGQIEDPAVALEQIDNGEVFIAKLKTLNDGERIDVKNGIIHHWYGAVFVEGVTLDDVLALVKDYEIHDRVFAPDIEASRILRASSDGNVFDISYRFRKKKVITVVLETEHHVEYTRVSADRAYSMSRTTKVQEVDDPDGRNEPKLPDTGRGFVWRINSYWRFEQQEGGTFIESESISLTRDIPLLLRPLISPFVNGVPKDTLTRNLENARDELLQATSPGGAEPGPR